MVALHTLGPSIRVGAVTAMAGTMVAFALRLTRLQRRVAQPTLGAAGARLGCSRRQALASLGGLTTSQYPPPLQAQCGFL
jgi:hypothetical protein